MGPWNRQDALGSYATLISPMCAASCFPFFSRQVATKLQCGGIAKHLDHAPCASDRGRGTSKTFGNCEVTCLHVAASTSIRGGSIGCGNGNDAVDRNACPTPTLALDELDGCSVVGGGVQRRGQLFEPGFGTAPSRKLATLRTRESNFYRP